LPGTRGQGRDGGHFPKPFHGRYYETGIERVRETPEKAFMKNSNKRSLKTMQRGIEEKTRNSE